MPPVRQEESGRDPGRGRGPSPQRQPVASAGRGPRGGTAVSLMRRARGDVARVPVGRAARKDGQGQVERWAVTLSERWRMGGRTALAGNALMPTWQGEMP